ETMVRAARSSAAGSRLTLPGPGLPAPAPHAAQIKNVPRTKRRMAMLPRIGRSLSRDGGSRAIAQVLPGARQCPRAVTCLPVASRDSIPCGVLRGKRRISSMLERQNSANRHLNHVSCDSLLLPQAPGSPGKLRAVLALAGAVAEEIAEAVQVGLVDRAPAARLTARGLPEPAAQAGVEGVLPDEGRVLLEQRSTLWRDDGGLPLGGLGRVWLGTGGFLADIPAPLP